METVNDYFIGTNNRQQRFPLHHEPSMLYDATSSLGEGDYATEALHLESQNQFHPSTFSLPASTSSITSATTHHHHRSHLRGLQLNAATNTTSAASSNIRPPLGPPVIYVSHSCLLIPVFVAAWYYYARTVCRRVVHGFIRSNPEPDASEEFHDKFAFQGCYTQWDESIHLSSSGDNSNNSNHSTSASDRFVKWINRSNVHRRFQRRSLKVKTREYLKRMDSMSSQQTSSFTAAGRGGSNDQNHTLDETTEIEIPLNDMMPSPVEGGGRTGIVLIKNNLDFSTGGTENRISKREQQQKQQQQRLQQQRQRHCLQQQQQQQLEESQWECLPDVNACVYCSREEVEIHPEPGGSGEEAGVYCREGSNSVVQSGSTPETSDGSGSRSRAPNHEGTSSSSSIEMQQRRRVITTTSSPLPPRPRPNFSAQQKENQLNSYDDNGHDQHHSLNNYDDSYDPSTQKMKEQQLSYSPSSGFPALVDTMT